MYASGINAMAAQCTPMVQELPRLQQKVTPGAAPLL